MVTAQQSAMVGGGELHGAHQACGQPLQVLRVHCADRAVRVCARRASVPSVALRLLRVLADLFQMGVRILRRMCLEAWSLWVAAWRCLLPWCLPSVGGSSDGRWARFLTVTAIAMTAVLNTEPPNRHDYHNGSCWASTAAAPALLALAPTAAAMFHS